MTRTQIDWRILPVKKLLKQAISEKIFPGGCVSVVFSDDWGWHPLFFYAGSLTYSPDSPAVSPITLYDLASVTKSVVTSTLASWLLDNNIIELDELVVKYIPELTTKYADSLTIRHLLTFTAEFDLTLSSLKNEPQAKIWQRVFEAELKNPPGTTYAYINTTSLILGKLIQRATHLPLDYLATKVLFDELGMSNTTFWPLTKMQHFPHLIAPTERDSWRKKLIHGEVHDESAWKLARKGEALGSAGLFSNVWDLSVFTRMILNKGEHNGRQLISKKMVKQWATHQLGEDSASQVGLGWELNQPWMGGDIAAKPKHRIGKTGFTGCTISADLDLGVGVVCLTNMIHPKRPKDRTDWKEWQQELHEIIYAWADAIH